MAFDDSADGPSVEINLISICANGQNFVKKILTRNESLATPVKSLKYLVELSLVECHSIRKIVSHLLDRYCFRFL